MATDRRRDPLPLLAGLVLVATGCGSQPAAPADVTTPTQRDASPRVVAETPDPLSDTGTAAALPNPADLGPGWSYRIEATAQQDGPDADSPSEERDPAEVIAMSIPMGCNQRRSASVPEEVRQSTYQHRPSGAYAVALRLRFRTAAAAEAFVEERGADLVTCRDQPDDPYSGAPSPVRDVTSTSWQTTTHYQLVGEAGTWTSAVRVEGSTVLSIDADPDKPDQVTWAALGFQQP